MSDNVKDLAEHRSRGGWITTVIPMMFNLQDVLRFEKLAFIFDDSDEYLYIIKTVFKHGDFITFVYADEASRDQDFKMLNIDLRRSKLKVLNGKPGQEPSKSD